MNLPEQGLWKNPKEIEELLNAIEKEDFKWDSGKIFGYVFDSGKKYRTIAEKTLLKFYHKSGLDFTVYPSLLQLENEVLDFAIKHLNGDKACSGNFTSGGTESILLAVKTARDYYISKNPKIKKPELLVPITAHPAFHKAAQYFGLKLKFINIDKNYKVDLNDLQKKITKNTIFIVGSAPSYTFGVIDPIEEMAEIAKAHKIWFHVDACMGGFLLPFFRQLKVPIPDFDFSVDGVTSISMDFHKYAYAPKGSSVILYKNKELRKHQIFTCSQWIGYTMVNTTIQSTKSGGPLAATYAILNAIGKDGYRELAKAKWEALNQIKHYIKQHPDLELVGDSFTPLIAFTSSSVNLFHIVDEMKIRGWYIQPVFSLGKIKESIHLSINYSNVNKIAAFLKDLEESIQKAKALPSGILLNKLKPYLNLLSNLHTSEDILKLFKMIDLDPKKLPERFAPINEVLNYLQPSIRERILKEYVNIIFR